jgi:anhydro-N-acetylmuramic acid kinase
MAHPFFASPPPKSLDRNAFPISTIDGLSLEDGAATLAAFTAAAVARGLEFTTGQARGAASPASGSTATALPERPSTLVVAGGGAHNPTIMRHLADRTGARIIPAHDIGLSADFLEAQAFAYLAIRSLAGLPLTFPGTTGVPAATAGGVIAD